MGSLEPPLEQSFDFLSRACHVVLNMVGAQHSLFSKLSCNQIE
jgi:hypothetical protein